MIPKVHPLHLEGCTIPIAIQPRFADADDTRSIGQSFNRFEIPWRRFRDVVGLNADDGSENLRMFLGKANCRFAGGTVDADAKDALDPGGCGAIQRGSQIAREAVVVEVGVGIEIRGHWLSGALILPSLPLGRGALEPIKTPLPVPKRDDPLPNGREGENNQ